MDDARPEDADSGEFRVPVGKLIALTPVAILVGAVSALGLWGISAVAELVQKLVWDDLSSALGVDSGSWWWIIVILSVVGLLSGLVISYFPGHAGDDPATAGLVAEPLAPTVLPGLVIATILTLAGGVSLGPENPIMAINAAIVVAVGVRFLPKIGRENWAGLSTAGTIGALFGTPVAAALMLSESIGGDQRVPLWNRLYVPLVAATTGSFVILHFTNLDLSIGLPQENVGGVVHVLAATGVAVVVAGIGVVGAYVFDPLHRVLNTSMRSPVLRLTVGGIVLGVLGAIGGSITLFKGLDEMKALPGEMATTSALGFFVIAGIKLCAMLFASAAGFRGGRIFPIAFVAVAVGFGIHALWTSMPLTLCVAAAAVGMTVAATRNGWISLFLGLAIVPQFDLITPLLFATLAAWLVVANAPELTARPLATSGQAVA